MSTTSPRGAQREGTKTCLSCGKEFGPTAAGKSNFAKQVYCSLPCFKDTLRKTAEQAFWEKVNKAGENGCWYWTGSIKPRNGYGHMRNGRKDYNAHRLSYQIHKGSIPAGMEVMHTCDVPHCVNPDHLKLGTHAENMADCKAKGRHTHGTKNPHAKLNEAQVRQIRAEFTRTSRKRSNSDELAAKYGVSRESITHIIARRTWSNLE